MRITLKQLLVFAAIARHENISLAARDVSLTQSAASMALKELESQLDAPLFHRQGKRLKLNSLGATLQPKVEQLLRLASEIETLATQDGLAGQLRVGASSTIGNYLVPSLIASFLSEHPGVRIDLKIANTEQIVEELLHLRIDIGLIEGLCDHPNIERIPWRDDNLKIFSARNHPLARKKRVTFRDLSEASWILREAGSGTRAIFTSATHDYFQPSGNLLELGNSEAIKQAVKTGFGISCLSEFAIASELKHRELCVLEVEQLDLRRQLFIIKNRSRIEGRLEGAFVEKLREAPKKN